MRTAALAGLAQLPKGEMATKLQQMTGWRRRSARSAVTAISRWRRRATMRSRPELSSIGHFWWLVELELERSRRNDRTFTLAALDLRPGDDRALEVVSSRLLSEVRACDAVTVVERIVLVLLSEADRNSAAHAVDRLVTQLGEMVGPDHVHTAGFPHDGLSLDAILAKLSDSLDDVVADSEPTPLRRPFSLMRGDGTRREPTVPHTDRRSS